MTPNLSIPPFATAGQTVMELVSLQDQSSLEQQEMQAQFQCETWKGMVSVAQHVYTTMWEPPEGRGDLIMQDYRIHLFFGATLEHCS